jgi:hypothetical protein
MNMKELPWLLDSHPARSYPVVRLGSNGASPAISQKARKWEIDPEIAGDAYEFTTPPSGVRPAI